MNTNKQNKHTFAPFTMNNSMDLHGNTCSPLSKMCSPMPENAAYLFRRGVLYPKKPTIHSACALLDQFIQLHRIPYPSKTTPHHVCTKTCKFIEYGDLFICLFHGSFHLCTVSTCNHMATLKNDCFQVCELTHRQYPLEDENQLPFGYDEADHEDNSWGLVHGADDYGDCTSDQPRVHPLSISKCEEMATRPTNKRARISKFTYYVPEETHLLEPCLQDTNVITPTSDEQIHFRPDTPATNPGFVFHSKPKEEEEEEEIPASEDAVNLKRKASGDTSRGVTHILVSPTSSSSSVLPVHTPSPTRSQEIDYSCFFKTLELDDPVYTPLQHICSRLWYLLEQQNLQAAHRLYTPSMHTLIILSYAFKGGLKGYIPNAHHPNWNVNHMAQRLSVPTSRYTQLYALFRTALQKIIPIL